MAKLQHPNIVTIFDYGSVGEIFYFVMEFVDGTDVQQLIKTGELTPESALDVVRQICEALQYAHGHGYIHRDIKPANVMVTKEGFVKVGDFGLEKLTSAGDGGADVSNLTMTGYVLGTPNYLAPESYEDAQKTDHRTDIYSLGVMFYEMLTGSLPKGISRDAIGPFAELNQHGPITEIICEHELAAGGKSPEHGVRKRR
ncbi:MAG: serine/threonine protein kinase [Verrucomicrobiales bacterium]|jgi:serine/threonine protein kinase